MNAQGVKNILLKYLEYIYFFLQRKIEHLSTRFTKMMILMMQRTQ